MSELAIECIALTRDFESVRALDGLNLAVPRGKVFGFIGPNGSGKTTTIRLLLGLLEPTSGTAKVLEKDTRTDGQAIRERCGALLEHSGLYERLGAEENLEFYARVQGMASAERSARIRELLDHLSLWDRRKEPVGTWSRGMKQKLAIARTMLHRPELVFLDEPTAGLDPVAAVALREDLLKLVQAEGTTVFLTTHNLTEAEKLCAQVAVLRAGKLLTVGSPHSLRLASGGACVEVLGSGFNDEALASLRSMSGVAHVGAEEGRWAIRLAGTADVSPLISDLLSHRVKIEEVRKGSPSLEDAVLALLEEEHV